MCETLCVRFSKMLLNTTKGNYTNHYWCEYIDRQNNSIVYERRKQKSILLINVTKPKKETVVKCMRRLQTKSKKQNPSNYRQINVH